MRYLPAILLASLLCVLLSCQTKADHIAAIRQEFTAINNDHSMQVKELENEEMPDAQTDGGSSLKGYYKGPELKKVVSWIGLSNGNWITEFYFKANRLIFVYARFKSFPYNEQLNEVRKDTTIETFSGRYYFNNDQLIDFLEKGVDPTNARSKKVSKELLQDAEEYRKLLATRAK